MNDTWPRNPEPSNDELNGSSHSGPKLNKKLVIIVAAAAALVVLVGSIFGVANWKRSVEAAGKGYQNSITFLYGNVLADLSNCLDKTMIAGGIAQSERESLGKTLATAVSARYTDASGRQVNPATAQGQAFIINVVKEAYPEVSNELFKDLMTTALGCRDQFTGTQEQLRAKIKEFRDWRAGGDVIAGSIRESFPTNALEVETLEGVVTGEAAEKFMDMPILTGDADEAGKSRRMPTQQPVPGSTPR